MVGWGLRGMRWKVYMGVAGGKGWMVVSIYS